jgi:hypothetical protein
VVVEQLLGRSEQSLVLERGSEQRRQGGRPKKCSAVVCVKPGARARAPRPSSRGRRRREDVPNHGPTVLENFPRFRQSR